MRRELEAPYAFQSGRWFSFWTVNNDCAWNDDVITLGLEDTTNRLTPAHIISTGGTVTRSTPEPVATHGVLSFCRAAEHASKPQHQTLKSAALHHLTASLAEAIEAEQRVRHRLG
jgi:hypothetical protein